MRELDMHEVTQQASLFQSTSSLAKPSTLLRVVCDNTEPHSAAASLRLYSTTDQRINHVRVRHAFPTRELHAHRAE